MSSNRLRVSLLSLLAVFAVSALASASAYAVKSDEYVWKVNGATLGAGLTEKAKTAGGPFILEGKIATVAVEIECKKQGEVEEGNIKGGNPGTDEATVTFTECKILNQALCKVAVANTKVKTELVEIIKVLKEDAVPPTEEAVDGHVGELFRPEGTKFTTITITGCALNGTFEVTGTVAAKLPGENTEKLKQVIEFRDSEPITEVENTADGKTKVGLKFGGEPAELVGNSEGGLATGLVFGPFIGDE
jgi:hypothetical protein